jgi:hypothetical protein
MVGQMMTEKQLARHLNVNRVTLRARRLANPDARVRDGDRWVRVWPPQVAQGRTFPRLYSATQVRRVERYFREQGWLGTEQEEQA